MIVSDLLRRKGGFVATTSPDATVADLLELLAEHRIGALVVSGDGSAVAGIVSERDVVRALRGSGGALLDAPVSDVMTSDVVTTSPHEALEGVMRLMTDRRIRHLPVVDGGALVGIISIGDVVAGRIDELQSDRDHLVDYINSAG